MSEGPPQSPPPERDPHAEGERREAEIIALAIELSKSPELFPFPGIQPEVYARLKAAEVEFPGYVTPIDELIARFKSEGMKVVLGRDPESGNVHILPASSDNIVQDSIFPRHLQLEGVTDEKLKRLILVSQP